jgi:hypothetical protein
MHKMAAVEVTLDLLQTSKVHAPSDTPNNASLTIGFGGYSIWQGYGRDQRFACPQCAKGIVSLETSAKALSSYMWSGGQDVQAVAQALDESNHESQK